MNFTVRIFLEGQEGELGRITRQMEALCLADEKCSLMEECLDTFADAIQEDPPWNCEPHHHPPLHGTRSNLCSTNTVVNELGAQCGHALGPGRLCQHNFKHNRLSILVRIMLE